MTPSNINNFGQFSLYTVDPAGNTPYTTIQAGINAAHAGGGGTVLVRPGVYTENLSIFGDTQIVGAVGNSDVTTTGNNIVKIDGVHTPDSAGGYISINNIQLTSATDIFNSAAVGTTTLILENCITNITNGFTFNLPNWTSIIAVFNLQEQGGGTNNGVINNTAGSVIYFQSSSVGTGTNVMLASGPTIMKGVEVGCPFNPTTGAQLDIHLCHFNAPVTISGNAAGILTSLQFMVMELLPLPCLLPEQ